ncbi:MAG: hypothetical protein NTZ16_15820 [Verrucomicrobia bacterium]|nr:hypothetical protein [Verrucomicrobiota bacterium]
MAWRSGKETPIDPDSGADVRYEVATKLGGETRVAYFVHPPYMGSAKGYTFWERRVSVPPNGVLEFDTGLSANGAAKGDGVTFIVQAAPERAGETGGFKELFRAHEKTSKWTRHAVSLKEWAGQVVWLKFISDCGPNNNTVADQSYWGDVHVAPARRESETETPAGTSRLASTTMTCVLLRLIWNLSSSRPSRSGLAPLRSTRVRT